jgi:hypothetical protein
LVQGCSPTGFASEIAALLKKMRSNSVRVDANAASHAKNISLHLQSPYSISWFSLALAAVLVLAPLPTSSAQPSVTAQEILAKIAAKEPAYYDGARISGDLDLSSLPGAQIPASFALVNCSLSNASFAGVTFGQDVAFWGTSFDNTSV